MSSSGGKCQGFDKRREGSSICRESRTQRSALHLNRSDQDISKKRPYHLRCYDSEETQTTLDPKFFWQKVLAKRRSRNSKQLSFRKQILRNDAAEDSVKVYAANHCPDFLSPTPIRHTIRESPPKCLGLFFVRAFLRSISLVLAFPPTPMSTANRASFRCMGSALRLEERYGIFPSNDWLRLSRTVTKEVLQLHVPTLYRYGRRMTSYSSARRGRRAFQLPCIAKTPPRAQSDLGVLSPAEERSVSPPFVNNITIFALGILLIEFCFRQTIEELRAQENVQPLRATRGRKSMTITNGCATAKTDRILKNGPQVQQHS